MNLCKTKLFEYSIVFNKMSVSEINSVTEEGSVMDISDKLKMIPNVKKFLIFHESTLAEQRSKLEVDLYNTLDSLRDTFLLSENNKGILFYVLSYMASILCGILIRIY